jgi:acyl-ACP thioesterase
MIPKVDSNAAVGSGLAKALMPVPDPHPDVFDRQWPLRPADVDRLGRLRLDAAVRHIMDIGQDHLREMGHNDTHPLWIVRRTMVDLIRDRGVLDQLQPRDPGAGPHRR